MRTFLAEESGSFSVEAVIWMPIFAIMLALILNISFVFFSESQMLRVVQDANRAFSLGRLDSTDATEAYVEENLAYLNATLTVASSLDAGVITTNLSAPATDLMPMNFMRGKFNGVQISVSAQHIVEF